MTVERTDLVQSGRDGVPSRPAKRHTRQGAAVDDVMRAADGFRSAQEIYAELVGSGASIGLTTVYRHLNSLVESGAADVVHRADGETQFKLCGDTEDRQHHHLVCRVCGRSEEVLGPEVEEWAERVAASAGYTQVSHTVEVFGLCREHSRRSDAAGPLLLGLRRAAPG
jgi:Fur family ferric uptake transcriptional regulator